jgi:predicted RecA/RadA family phage recombinase
MATNFVQPGCNITVTNEDITDAAALESGDGFLVGSLFGICLTDCAVGDDVVLATEGVWDIAKTSAEAWTVGQKIYWVVATSLASSTAGSNKQIGVAVAAAANPSSTGRVRLTAGFTI